MFMDGNGDSDSESDEEYADEDRDLDKESVDLEQIDRSQVADLLEERDLQDQELLLHHQEDHTPLHLTATAAQDLQQLQPTHSLKNLEAMDLVHPLLTVDMELQEVQPVLVMELQVVDQL